MERSEQINELLTAISQSYSELKNAPLDGNNPHFKSKYATLEGILNVVRPVVSKYGLMFSQMPETIDNEMYLTTFIGHKSGQWMKSSLKLFLKDATSQQMGSAISYAKRYSLSAYFGIGEGEDDDGNEASKDNGKVYAKPIEEPLITAEQLKNVQSRADLLPKERVKEILDTKKWTSWGQMKQKQYNDCIAFLDQETKKELDKELSNRSDKAPWEGQ